MSPEEFARSLEQQLTGAAPVQTTIAPQPYQAPAPPQQAIPMQPVQAQEPFVPRTAQSWQPPAPQQAPYQPPAPQQAPYQPPAPQHQIVTYQQPPGETATRYATAPDAYAGPPAQQAKRGRRSKEDKAREDGFVLYVNCVPVKGATADDASERLFRVARAVAAAAGVTHYRQIEYGAGPGLFAEALAADLAANVQVNPITLRTETGEGRDAYTVLAAMAREIVVA